MKTQSIAPSTPRNITTAQPPDSGGGLAVDGRFKPFNVNHTDSKGRAGMYVDQSAPFKALMGADGKPQAVAYTAGFAVDTDGEGPHHGDKYATNQTSLQVGGHYANADKLPYLALPPGFAKTAGIKLGDVVQVTTPNGKTAYGIYADSSDDRSGRKLGEGSPALLRALGYSGKTLDPNAGGLAGGVKFVAFPGSGKTLGTTQKGFPSSDQVQVWGKQLAAKLSGTATPAPAGQPRTPTTSDGMSSPVQPGPVDVRPSGGEHSVSYAPAPGLDQVASGDGLMKLGQQGESVKQLQQMLGMSGEAVDGMFGANTEQAVTRFQKAHGLEVDGKVGPQTLSALQQKESASLPMLKQGASGEQVEMLQKQLKQAGFDPGELDGKFGSRTEAAVKAFQQAKGLEVDGMAGPRTQQALGQPASGTQWTAAPSLADVESGKGLLKQGMQGDAVKELQKRLGLEQDGKFGKQTQDAVAAFQKSHGLTPPPGLEGQAGKTTLDALKKAATTGGTNGAVLGNGVRIDTNHPILKKLATAHLNNGPTGYCVLTTLNNMHRLGIPHTPEATGSDPNNPRGGMAQMLRNGGWESVPFPGSRQETIRSNYGTATANVVSASQYRKLVEQGKVPDGAIIFQTRHGWDWSAGSKGNDMGIVRNNGRTTHNYQSMNSIIYSDCKDVVILVPKGAIQRD
jgi:peptidoglycan hydrolase-like protein with peptidoglycan-binding domain